MRLDKFLTNAVPDLSRSRLKALLEEGHVIEETANKAITSASFKVREQMIFTVTPPALIDPDPQPEDIPLDIYFEDDDLIVVNKPAGMVVHPAAGNWTGTLVHALLFHCGDSLSGIGGVKRPGIVHRIDKDTSGLLVVAKNDATHQALSDVFSRHDIHRSYIAIAKGGVNPPHGRVETMIARHPHNRKKMAVSKGKGKVAITDYKTLSQTKMDDPFSASLIECRLHTGRTHQVRVHMAHLGCPLIGDPVYARKISLAKAITSPLREQLSTFHRQALHARELGFKHPKTGEDMLFTCALPKDMEDICRSLFSANDISSLISD